MPTPLNSIVASVKPNPGEDQPAFARRFHAGLRKALPSTSQRNEAMFAAWGRDPLLVRACDEHYPSDKYELREKVPEWAEHTAECNDGSVQRYEVGDLEAIVRNLNRRVSDTGNYSVLIDGHTSDDPRDPEPDVVGYAGPFYLGMIGEDNPRWAIFADEHHHRDALPLLARHPNRSPEVWRSPNPRDRILDPIAVLGAETPRLNLGMVRYSIRAHRPGSAIDRFEGEATPGAGNVMVPQMVGSRRQKDRYSDEEGASETMLDNAEVQKIVSAVMDAIDARPQEQFVNALMQQMGWGLDGDNDDKEPDEDNGGAQAANPDAAEPSNGEPDGDDMPPAPMAAKKPPVAAPAPENAATDNDEPDSPMGDGGMSGGTSSPAAGSDVDDAGNADVAALKARIAELEKQLAEAKKGDDVAKYQLRRKALSDRRQQGLQIDVDAELEFASGLDDGQFDKYCKRLDASAVRVPLADSFAVRPDQPAQPAPQPGSSELQKEVDRYSRDAQMAARGTKGNPTDRLRAYTNHLRSNAPQHVLAALGIN